MNDPVNFPFVCAMHDDRCLVCYKQFLLITGAAGQMTIKLSQFYGSPISIFATEAAVYIAYADVLDRVRIGKSRVDQPQRLNVAGCRTMTAVNNELVLMTYTEPLIVGAIPAPGTMVDMFIGKEKARARELLGLLERNAASDLAFSMFKLMWKDGRKSEAFDLVSGTLIVGHVPDILALVPIIMQVKTPPMNGDLVPMGSTDISLLPQLSTFLKFTRKEYLHHMDDVELLETMSLIDTSLAQILAVESRTRELAALLEDGNVNAFILKEFCQIHSNSLGLGPGYAVLLTYLDQVEEAMTLWMKLEELKLKAGKENPLFIQEASITLRKLDDSSKLPLYLDWLFKHDPAAPQCVMEALLSPRHDPNIVEGWLQSKNLVAEKMKYDCYKVFHPGGETIANGLLITLLDILKDIDSPSFDRSRIKFTKASALAANAMIHEAEKEIEGIVIQILQLLGSVIDDEKALSHTQSKKVRLSIYQAKGRYEEGLQLLRNNGEFILDEVAEFCRGSVDPTKLICKIGKRDVNYSKSFQQPVIIRIQLINGHMHTEKLEESCRYLLAQGASYTEIQRILHISSKTISSIRKGTFLQKNHSCGRPSVITDEMKDFINSTWLVDARITDASMTELVNSRFHTDISESTVCRVART